MKNIDDLILSSEYFWLTDENKTIVFFNKLSDLNIPEDMVHLSNSLNPDDYAFTKNGKIFIDNRLMRAATHPQLLLATLHEYAHIRLKGRSQKTQEESWGLEFDCDKWAIEEMIKSGLYTIGELVDAAALFGGVIVGGGTRHHPTSQSRHKRLKMIIWEYVS